MGSIDERATLNHQYLLFDRKYNERLSLVKEDMSLAHSRQGALNS
jgi:hypothetical protein